MDARMIPDEIEVDVPAVPSGYYETFVMDDEHPEHLPAGFICHVCRRPVDDGPCPEHAPTEVPGLALVDCEATPRHWVWTLASDANGYGNPCYRCIVDEQAEKRMQASACRHWGWRRWRIARRVGHVLYVSGITAGGGGSQSGNGCDWCATLPRFNFDPRVYALGISRDTWRCWLIGHHRRGEEVGFGFCGKCVPWSCCESQFEAHKAGCPEMVDVNG